MLHAACWIAAACDRNSRNPMRPSENNCWPCAAQPDKTDTNAQHVLCVLDSSRGSSLQSGLTVRRVS